MLPQGMFSVAVATVLFPSLSRLASRAPTWRLPRTVADRVCGRSRSCSSRRASSAPCSPSRSSGSSTSAASSRRTRRRSSRAALAAFSLGLTFNGMMLLLNRAFFSLQSHWIPTLVALGEPRLNAALDLVLLPRSGSGAMPLATSIVEHRRRRGAARPAPPSARRARAAARHRCDSVLRITAASAALGAASRMRSGGVLDDALWPQLPRAGRLGRRRARGRWPWSYLVACRALGVRELAGAAIVARRASGAP